MLVICQTTTKLFKELGASLPRTLYRTPVVIGTVVTALMNVSWLVCTVMHNAK